MDSHSYVDDFASVLKKDISDDDFASMVSPNSPPNHHHDDYSDDNSDKSNDDDDNNHSTDGFEYVGDNGVEMMPVAGPTIAGMPIIHGLNNKNTNNKRPSVDDGDEYSVMYANSTPSVVRTYSNRPSESSLISLNANESTNNPNNTKDNTNPESIVVPKFQRTGTMSMIFGKKHTQNDTKNPKNKKNSKNSKRSIKQLKSQFNHGITISTNKLTIPFNSAAGLNKLTTVHYPGSITCVIGDASLRSYLHTIAGYIDPTSIRHGKLTYNGISAKKLWNNDVLNNLIGYYDTTSANSMFIGSVYNMLMCYKNHFKLVSNNTLLDELPAYFKRFDGQFEVEYMISLFSFSFAPIPRLYTILDEIDMANGTSSQIPHNDQPDTRSESKFSLFNSKKKPLTFANAKSSLQLLSTIKYTHVESLTEEDVYILTIIGFILARYPIIVLQPPPMTISLQNLERIMMLLHDFASFNRTTIVMGIHSTISAKSLLSINQLLLLYNGTPLYQGPTKDVVTFMDTAGLFIPPSVDVIDYLQLLVTQPKICVQTAHFAHEQQAVERAQKQVQFELAIPIIQTPQQLEDEQLTTRNLAELELRSPNSNKNGPKNGRTIKRGISTYRLITHDPDGKPLSEEEVQRQIDDVKNGNGVLVEENDDFDVSQTQNKYSKFVNVKRTKSGFVFITAKHDGWDLDSDNDEDDDEEDYEDGNGDVFQNDPNFLNHNQNTNTNNPNQKNQNQKNRFSALNIDPNAQSDPYNSNQFITVQNTSNILPLQPITYQSMTLDQEQYFIANKNLPIFRSTQKQYDSYLSKYHASFPPELKTLLDNGTVVPTTWGYIPKPKYPCQNMEQLNSYYTQSIFYNVIEYDSCIYSGTPVPQKHGKRKSMEPCIIPFDVFSRQFLNLCVKSMQLLPSAFFRRVVNVSTPLPMTPNHNSKRFLQMVPSTPLSAIAAKGKGRSDGEENDTKITKNDGGDGDDPDGVNAIPIFQIEDGDDDSDDDDDKKRSDNGGDDTNDKNDENDEKNDKNAKKKSKPPIVRQETEAILRLQIGDSLPTQHLLSPSESTNTLISSTPLIPKKSKRNQTGEIDDEKNDQKNDQKNDPKDDSWPLDYERDQVGGELAVIMDVDDEDERPINPYDRKFVTPGGEIDNNNFEDDWHDPVSYSHLSQYSVYQTAGAEFSRISRNDSVFEDIEPSCINDDGTIRVKSAENHDDDDDDGTIRDKSAENHGDDGDDDVVNIETNNDITNDDHFDPVSYTHLRYSKMYKNVHSNDADGDEDDEDDEEMQNEKSCVFVEESRFEDNMVTVYTDDSSDEDGTDGPKLIDTNGLDQEDIEMGLVNVNFNGKKYPMMQNDQNLTNPLTPSQSQPSPKNVTIAPGTISPVKNKIIRSNNDSDGTKQDRFALPYRKTHFFHWRLWFSTAINMASSDFSFPIQFVIVLVLCALGFAFFTPINELRTVNPISPSDITTEPIQLRLGMLWYLISSVALYSFFSIPQYFKQHRHVYSSKKPIYSAFVSNLILEQFILLFYAAIMGTIIVPITLWKDSSSDGEYTLDVFSIMLLLYVLSLFAVCVNRFFTSFIPYLRTNTILLMTLAFHLCFLAVGAWWVPLTWLSSWLKWTRWSSPYNWIFYALIFKEFSYNNTEISSIDYIQTQILDFNSLDKLSGWDGALKESWFLISIIWTLAASLFFFILYLYVILSSYSKTHNRGDLLDNLFMRYQKSSSVILKQLNVEALQRGQPAVTDADLKPLLHSMLTSDRAQEVIDKSNGILTSLLHIFSYEPIMIAYRDATLISQNYIPTPDIVDEVDNVAFIHPTIPRLKNFNMYAQPGSVTLLTSPSSLVPTDLPLNVLVNPNNHLIHGDICIKLQNIVSTTALPSNRCHYTLIDGESSTLHFADGCTVKEALSIYLKLYMNHIESDEVKDTALNQVIDLCDLRTFLNCKVATIPPFSDQRKVYSNPDEYLTREQFLLVQLALGLLTGSTLFLLRNPFYYLAHNPHFIIVFMSLLRRLAAFSYTTIPNNNNTRGGTKKQHKDKVVTHDDEETSLLFRYTFLISERGTVMPTPALHMCDKIGIWTQYGENVYFGDIGKRAKILTRSIEKFPSLSSFPTTMNPLTYFYDLLQTGYTQKIDFDTKVTSLILPTTPNIIIDENDELQTYTVKPTDIMKFRRISNGFTLLKQNTDTNNNNQITLVAPNMILSGVGDVAVVIDDVGGGNNNNNHNKSTHSLVVPTSANSCAFSTATSQCVASTLHQHRHEIQGVNDDLVRYYKGSVHFEKVMRHINKIFDYNCETIKNEKNNTNKFEEESDDENNNNNNKNAQKDVEDEFLTLDEYRVSNNINRKPFSRTPIAQLYLGFMRRLLLSVNLIHQWITIFIPSAILSFVVGLLYLTFGSNLDDQTNTAHLYPGEFNLLPFFTVQFCLPLIISSIIIILFQQYNVITSLTSYLHITTTNPIKFPSRVLNSEELGYKPSKIGLFFSKWNRASRYDFQSQAILPILLATLTIDIFITIPILSACVLIPYYGIVRFDWYGKVFFKYLLTVYFTTLSTYSIMFFILLCMLYITRNISSHNVIHTLSSLLPRAFGAIFIMISMLFGGMFTSFVANINVYIGISYISIVIPLSRAIQAGYTLIIPANLLLQYYENNPNDGRTNIEWLLYDAINGTKAYFWVNLLIILAWSCLFIILGLIVVWATRHRPNHRYFYPNHSRFF